MTQDMIGELQLLQMFEVYALHFKKLIGRTKALCNLLSSPLTHRPGVVWSAEHFGATDGREYSSNVLCCGRGL